MNIWQTLNSDINGLKSDAGSLYGGISSDLGALGNATTNFSAGAISGISSGISSLNTDLTISGINSVLASQKAFQTASGDISSGINSLNTDLTNFGINSVLASQKALQTASQDVSSGIGGVESGISSGISGITSGITNDILIIGVIAVAGILLIVYSNKK